MNWLTHYERNKTMNYLIGQRVLLNGEEIGVVTVYAPHNVKPLPNGQL